MTVPAKPSVLTLQKANLISGFSDSSFSPNSPASCAQAAKILALIHFAIDNE
ncbi:MAG: S-layer homology domain-containing protein [Oscillospiraceae bacterium]|nr:S-layer homology domain-containing protein [Oscillospiraceae bacterium]